LIRIIGEHVANKTSTKRINKPRISNWIGGLYIGMAIFIALLFTSMAFLTGMPAPFLGIGVLLFAILGFIAYCFYGTVYVIEDGVLNSWSPFMTIRLKISDIKDIERTRVPMHLRAGAGGYCGKFYIAGVGWTRAIISNFVDGVLITDKKGKHYLITPSSPDSFVKSLK
jgi:hypothetical protein